MKMNPVSLAALRGLIHEHVTPTLYPDQNGNAKPAGSIYEMWMSYFDEGDAGIVGMGVNDAESMEFRAAVLQSVPADLRADFYETCMLPHGYSSWDLDEALTAVIREQFIVSVPEGADADLAGVKAAVIGWSEYNGVRNVVLRTDTLDSIQVREDSLEGFWSPEDDLTSTPSPR